MPKFEIFIVYNIDLKEYFRDLFRQKRKKYAFYILFFPKLDYTDEVIKMLYIHLMLLDIYILDTKLFYVLATFQYIFHKL